MESFSMRADCPGPEQLLDELARKLDGYCKYEVFEYASGKVVTIAFEKYYFRIKSNLLVTVTLDFARAGTCQIDIVSGGGPEGTVDFLFGVEKESVSDVIQMLADTCDARGWNLREDESESGRDGGPEP